LPFLGLIPKLIGFEWFGKTPQNQILKYLTSAFAESIRTLHTSILLSGVEQPPKRILITSAQPKEGKTTIAVCFARMLAKSGQKVLLIDVDLRTPAVHAEYKLSLPSCRKWLFLARKRLRSKNSSMNVGN